MKHFFSISTQNLLKSTRRGALLLALGAVGPAAWGQSFGPVSLYSTGTVPTGLGNSLPTSIALGDVNRDGRLDIVAGSYQTNAVAVLLGQAGGFAPVVAYPTVTNSTATNSTATNVTPLFVTLGDLNGDGRLDVIAGTYSNAVAVLYGQAGGGFSAVSTYLSTAGGGVGRVAVGDMNGDGRLDIVTSNNGTVGVLLGLAGGGFAPVITYTTNTLSSDVIISDINRDGRLDIVTASNGQVAVLYGQAGGFAPVIRYPDGRSQFENVTVGDINGDSWPDIITTSDNSMGSVNVLLGQASGFLPVSSYSASTPSAVAVGDVTGDGRLDVIVTTSNNNVSNTVGILAGQVNGFAPIITYPAGAGTIPRDVELGDINGDGRLDIVTANHITNNVGVLLNTGTFTPLATTRPTPADISLAPNPAHDAFTVQLPAGTAASPAELLNALGQVVRRPVTAAGTHFTVETAGLAPGIYTLRLTLGTGTVAKRVVVE